MKALPLILLTACSLPGGGTTTEVNISDRPGQSGHDSGVEHDSSVLGRDADMPDTADVALEQDSGTGTDSGVPIPVGGALCASCDATYDATKGRCANDPDLPECVNACLEKTLRCVGGRCMAWEERTTPTLADKCKDAGGVYKSIGPAGTSSLYLPSVCILECSP